MITNVLVANRGEIARRVFRSCRSLGIGCVAVYSDADAGAPHVREADAAVRLPGETPAETYLRADLMIGAARAAGADAVHPGYGFLAENAAFARAVIDAGLTWIGPGPAAIESMGSKIESKRLMAEAGVPVLAELDPAQVGEDELPVLVKASAGGGGRGMRVVRALAELVDEVAAAQSEARSAFGDPTVFCEPYLPTGRHIEVQIMADAHGGVLAVGERECSIQRRHQKVLEEAPSPLVERTPGMREELFDAATKAAKAIDYTGAGTVEFLADEQGRFFFLEMNTRLQVEHPVTECTTGLDLVELQLDVAAGARLPADPVVRSGHSIEVRLYAEDPAQEWQPQSGVLHRFEVPGVTAEFAPLRAPGLRLDSGVHGGSAIGVHYDPMLAKVISYARSREQAAQRLAGALRQSKVHGPRTNRDLLVRVLLHPAFLAGDTDTAFFDRHGLPELAEPLADERTESLCALAAALADAGANRGSAGVLAAAPSGWRNVAAHPQRKSYLGGAGEQHVEYRLSRGELRAEGHPGVRLLESGPGDVVLEVDGVRRAFAVHDYTGQNYGGLVHVDSPLGSVALERLARFTDPSAQSAPGSLFAPMPGTVTRIAVSVGDEVPEGAPLLWMEAMKMEHRIAAPTAGVVTELAVRTGQQVDLGAVLAVVSEAAS
jgi:propionyl-CoA carboxylase alpha chain